MMDAELARSNQLQEQVTRLSGERSKALDELSAMTRARDAALDDASTLRTSLQQLEHRYDAIVHERDDALTRVRSGDEMAALLRGQAGDLKTKVGELQSQLDGVTRHSSTVEMDAKQKQSTLQQLMAERNALQSSVDELTHTAQKLREEKAQLGERVARLSADVSAMDELRRTIPNAEPSCRSARSALTTCSARSIVFSSATRRSRSRSWRPSRPRTGRKRCSTRAPRRFTARCTCSCAGSRRFSLAARGRP